VPYVWGGATPQGFDCSGPVMWLWANHGVALPHFAASQFHMGPFITKAELRPGDLVYFNPKGGRVSHIGIYVGEGRFVHAPSRGGTVRLDTLRSDYWTKYFVAAKRVLQ